MRTDYRLLRSAVNREPMVCDRGFGHLACLQASPKRPVVAGGFGSPWHIAGLQLN